jgi:hypothetical protein
MSAASPTESILTYWTIHGVQHFPGVGEADLNRFEELHKVKLPRAMRDFYRATNGTNVPGSTGQDHNAFHFWALWELCPDERVKWAFPFVDYREQSWRYAIDLSGEGGAGHGAIYILAEKPLLVATTFKRFATMYVRDEKGLYY